jgi:hypothetical protein
VIALGDLEPPVAPFASCAACGRLKHDSLAEALECLKVLRADEREEEAPAQRTLLDDVRVVPRSP